MVLTRKAQRINKRNEDENKKKREEKLKGDDEQVLEMYKYQKSFLTGLSVIRENLN